MQAVIANRGAAGVECRGLAHESRTSNLIFSAARVNLDSRRSQLANPAASAAICVNHRDTEPYVRWCGRTVRLSRTSYPIALALSSTRCLFETRKQVVFLSLSEEDKPTKQQLFRIDVRQGILLSVVVEIDPTACDVLSRLAF